MRRLSRLFRVVGLVLLLGVAVVTPVLAIDDPTDTSIKSAKVFQSIFSDDDMLFFVRYDVNYSSDPDEPADETFVVSLYDTDGTTLLYQRELNYYGLNIISIYLTPVQAAGLTWENEYVIKVMGNPSIFDELTEGVNMATRSLSPSNDYISGDMDTSRGFLGQFCIDTAKVLQADWGITLVTGSDKLNVQGSITFNAAIPGLYTAVPGIYSTAVAPPELDIVTRTVVLKGTVTGTFTSGETVTGGTSGAVGTFIVDSQTGEGAGKEIQVTHSGVTMFREDETAVGGSSSAEVEVSGVVVGQIEEAARARTGTRLRNALDGFGAWLGMSGNAVGGIALFGLFALTAGFVFTATGNVHGSILVAIPVILLGNFMGLLSFAITWMVVVIVVLLFAILFIMGRLA